MSLFLLVRQSTFRNGFCFYHSATDYHIIRQLKVSMLTLTTRIGVMGAKVATWR